MNLKFFRGTYDYFGLNHYTSDVVESLPYDEILNWPDDDGLEHSNDPNWQTAQSTWLKVSRKFLNIEVDKLTIINVVSMLLDRS